MGKVDPNAKHPAKELTPSLGDSTEAPAQGVQSLETGLEIARLLAASRKPMGVSEIAAALQLSPSSVHRYLVSLSRAGLAEQLSSNGKYDLGPLALHIGLQAMGRLDAQRHLLTAVERLADSTELTAQGVIWSDQGPTIVQWKDSSKPVIVSARLGSALPLVTSAAGIVFCAHLPPKAYSARLERELRHDPPPTNFGRAVTAEFFSAMLGTVRKTGYASVQGDFVAGIDAVSAPVFDSHRRIAFALSIMGSRGGVDLNAEGFHIQSVQSAARDLSERLGFNVQLASEL